jgi:hypothetical protein
MKRNTMLPKRNKMKSNLLLAMRTAPPTEGPLSGKERHNYK